MSAFCGLCQCVVEGSWEEHVKSQQHQDNLADPGKTGSAKVRHEMDSEEAMKHAGEDMRGITWIQVLITLAILGILAAVIIPRLLGY